MVFSLDSSLGVKVRGEVVDNDHDNDRYNSDSVGNLSVQPNPRFSRSISCPITRPVMTERDTGFKNGSAGRFADLKTGSANELIESTEESKAETLDDLPDLEFLLSGSLESGVDASRDSEHLGWRPTPSFFREEEEEEQEGEKEKAHMEEEEEDNNLYAAAAEENETTAREAGVPFPTRLDSLEEEKMSFLLESVLDGSVDLMEEMFYSDSPPVDSFYAASEESHQFESITESARKTLGHYSTTDEVGKVVPPKLVG